MSPSILFHRFRKARVLAIPLPPIIVTLVGLVAAGQLMARPWAGTTALMSHGLVTPLFLVTLIALGCALGIILVVGRIRVEDVGLDPDYVGRGFGLVVMTWAAAQVVGVIPRVVANRPVVLDPVFEHGSRWELFGTLLTSLGTASLEEIVFRGFLLIQIYLLLLRKPERSEQALYVATAVVLLLSSLAALPHDLPFASWRAAVEHELIFAGGGLFLTWLFLRTRNIFFVIGVHALLLAPTPIVAGPTGGGRWFHP
ncbi:MAG: CPBP family glutamic-type intramembrane protease, partial [Gemmatimonadota bacterium]